ncbi:hypothetical protein ACIQMV_12895 [Streptomyces sp. NPDC091412]|uniref:hypothetical protein n=1 Tax=Streptomyces sp. NPDC091412 TaxID=3366002 RepID=UPI0037F666EB
MDVARMVLDYLKVLIWPVTTLAIVYGFRGQFKDLIRRIRLLSGPGIDAEFSERVLEASEGAEVAVLSHPPGDALEGPEPSGPSAGGAAEPPAEEAADQSRHHLVRGYLRTAPDEDDALILLTDNNPHAAVVAAFIGVESELRRLEDRELPTVERRRPTRQLVEALPLPPDIRNSIVEMSRLRNRAAHGEQVVSAQAARAFVRSSIELIDWLKAFGDQPRLF